MFQTEFRDHSGNMNVEESLAGGYQITPPLLLKLQQIMKYEKRKLQHHFYGNYLPTRHQAAGGNVHNTKIRVILTGALTGNIYVVIWRIRSLITILLRPLIKKMPAEEPGRG